MGDLGEGSRVISENQKFLNGEVHSGKPPRPSMAITLIQLDKFLGAMTHMRFVELQAPLMRSKVAVLGSYV